MTYEEYIEIQPFIKNFLMHFDLLLKRYDRLKELNKNHQMNIDTITFLDMIIVQLRAICIESPNRKKNYTVQNLLKIVGEDELAEQVEKMLNELYHDGSEKCDIKKAIKILADEFICHYDNFENEREYRGALSNVLFEKMLNPYEPRNLNYIMKVIITCVVKGITPKYTIEVIDDET